MDRPHKCPVCYGSGVVPQGFYSGYQFGMTTSTAPEQCKSCNGTGVIWNYEPCRHENDCIRCGTPGNHYCKKREATHEK